MSNIKDNLGINNSIMTMDWKFPLGARRFEGIAPDLKFGRNPAVGATEVTIWDGEIGYPFLSAAEILQVVSDDVKDVFETGDGAWSISITGLDANWDEITEIVELNGTTTVETTNKFLRVFRASVINAGVVTSTNGNNVGAISITSKSTSKLQAKILAGIGQTLMLVRTVPRGYTALVTGISFSVGEGKDCIVIAKTRSNLFDNAAFNTKYTLDLFEANYYATLESPFYVPEKTDIVWNATSSAAGTKVSGSFGYILVKNELIEKA